MEMETRRVTTKEVKRMAMEASDVSAFMLSAYRNGVLDRFVPILGKAMDGALAEAGVGLEQIVYQIDEAGEDTLRRLGLYFSRSAVLMRLAASDAVMKVLSVLLGTRLVSRSVEAVLRFSLGLVLSSGADAGTLGERLKARVGARRGGPRREVQGGGGNGR